ncbi:MAG: hypothetical protein DRN64_04540 [Thaumarchaeota archaeon]|nr:MAG: hypothetical protein DRN64_04540 [Nitrososphaerota archaeon]
MSSLRRFQDKIDVLDLIINVLKDHEKSLSDFIEKMDTFIKEVSVFKKVYGKSGISRPRMFTQRDNRNIIFVECERWSDFKEVSMGARLVAFEVRDGGLHITSISDGFIFKHLHKLPSSEAVTSLSPESLDVGNVKCWLSDELKVPENRIVEGHLSEP